jgi:hypothetical protein
VRIFSADPRYYLIEVTDLKLDPMPDIVRDNLPYATTIVNWAREYLCQPHSELGRDGPVCPFVPYSLQHCLFFVTVQRGEHLTESDVYDTVMKYRDWFLEMEPREGSESRYKSINILFPDIPLENAPQIIDTIQLALKPEFVARGLMIGQFHGTPPAEGGLWNPDFRPLKSPIPLLSMRHMVPTDFAFLTKDKRYVDSYLQIHGENIPRRQRQLVEEMARMYGIDLPNER